MHIALIVLFVIFVVLLTAALMKVASKGDED